MHNTWSDPGKEAASTNALANQGVDVITMIVDSPITVVQTAEQRGMYSAGFHSTGVQKYAPKGGSGKAQVFAVPSPQKSSRRITESVF
jgi:basic membrane lipoprotein Med (substrate-binding protein (PBP1-ABC) superfamily)